MKITFAGLKTTGKVEMVWAVMNLERSSYNHEYSEWSSIRYTDYIIVWGRRGGKLRTLRIKDDYHCEISQRIFDDTMPLPNRSFFLVTRGHPGNIPSRVLEKLRQDYQPVKADKLSDIYPEFEYELDKINFWEQLRT